MEKTEYRINELEERTTEITQSEQQKIDWKKFNRISGTSGTITEALTFVSHKHPRKGGEKRWGWITWRTNR